ncbi:methylase [Mycolicibacterium agri]|uniref:Methylase n=1 Tax=Mycolicibacterium agri TaxID=36811 RepID=A0A2A7N6B0_MYCAG|nr:class I SAM-dependent methyltransferase [Mycolicibacterium agri]PEG39313.1 methylase [Mycolicibacterium agri]GFG51689.1 hypothetical protein MAGR_31300 [Mycolicibacterium agri]
MTYLFGHTDPETRRLQLQSRLYDGHMEYALRLAGLRPGMRVLDVGCGVGDVSFLAAGLVGPTGSVTGVDMSGDVIEHARRRAREFNFPTVRFVQSAIDDIALDEPVDAVIGRLILMHLPDPVEALRKLAVRIRPGGVVAFSDFENRGTASVPETPLCEAILGAIRETFARMGVDSNFGLTMHQCFSRAGLDSPRMTLGAPVAGPDDILELTWLAETWRSLLPLARKLAVNTDGLTDTDEFPSRLQQELADAGAVFMLPALITAWARI